jgi:hypothetical protein
VKAKVPLLFSAVLVVCALSAPVSAEPRKGAFGIGLNYPGLGVRYLVTDALTVEGKIQTETDILVAGLRLYRNFSSGERGKFFWGLEGDYLSFKGDVSEGTGIAGELLVGGEYFVAKGLSFQMDLGPAYINVTDGDTTLSVNGMEFVANFGINYYLGGK